MSRYNIIEVIAWIVAASGVFRAGYWIGRSRELGLWEPKLESLADWYAAQMSDVGDRDQCGVPIGNQRRHLATERLLQECRRMWGDA